MVTSRAETSGVTKKVYLKKDLYKVVQKLFGVTLIAYFEQKLVISGEGVSKKKFHHEMASL